MKKILSMIPMAALACGISSAHALTLPAPIKDVPLTKIEGNAPHPAQTLTVAGGCFWGIQAVFQHVKGVTKAVSGYAGGDAMTAHYDIVSSGTTAHAESVQITYDPSQITVGTLLQVFFSVAHDPTELNKQGPDHGTQYRSAIFYTSPEQKDVAAAYIDQLQQAKVFDSPIVTKLEPLQAFYPAEEYHQDYARLHPNNMYIMINDAPKVRDLEAKFPTLYVKL